MGGPGSPRRRQRQKGRWLSQPGYMGLILSNLGRKPLWLCPSPAGGVSRAHYHSACRLHSTQIHHIDIHLIHNCIHIPIRGMSNHINPIYVHSRTCQWYHNHPLIFSKLFNICEGYHLQNLKLQKISLRYLRRLKDMPVCCAALAAPFHLFTDRIKEVGDQWTPVGDLGDSVEDFVGGFGNADVPIWWGVNGVGTLSLPAVPEVLRGPFPVYQCHPVVRSSLVLPSSAIWCLLPSEVCWRLLSDSHRSIAETILCTKVPYYLYYC